MATIEDAIGGVPLATIPDDIFQTYETLMVPAVFEPWGRRVIEAARLAPGERVLDVACATGIVARLAAAAVGERGSVAGLDFLPGMLELAGASSKGVRPEIEWVEGDAQEMPLPDDSFDAVLCQQGLQFFPEKVQALREARRVLTGGGRIVASVWRAIDRSPAVAALQEALERHAPDVAGFLPLAFSLSDGDELRASLLDAGFADVRVRIEVGAARFSSVEHYLNTYLGATPVGGVVAALPVEARSAIVEDVTTSVEPYLDDDGLVVVQETNVVSGRA